MQILIDILLGTSSAVVAFITLGITERFVKPKAIEVVETGYEYLKGYVQPALDKLDFNLSLVGLDNYVDDSILPPDLTKEEQQQLLNLIAKAFSLDVHLNKTQQSK